MTPTLSRFQAILRDAGLDARVVEACAVHFSLVLKWNPTHNLTRVDGEEAAAVVHYLDCALPLLLAERELGTPTDLLDVGSGAGFPGLVAAILWPEVPVTLVEPARKRASFLQIAAGQLGLKKVTVTSPPATASSLQTAQSAEATQTLTASSVLSRATFSAGVRGNLWPYVRAGHSPAGALWAWSSHHERDTWETEAATWGPGAITWHPYDLPTLPRAAADPDRALEPLKHGLLIVRRA